MTTTVALAQIDKSKPTDTESWRRLCWKEAVRPMEATADVFLDDSDIRSPVADVSVSSDCDFQNSSLKGSVRGGLMQTQTASIQQIPPNFNASTVSHYNPVIKSASSILTNVNSINNAAMPSMTVSWPFSSSQTRASLSLAASEGSGIHSTVQGPSSMWFALKQWRIC